MTDYIRLVTTVMVLLLKNKIKQCLILNKISLSDFQSSPFPIHLLYYKSSFIYVDYYKVNYKVNVDYYKVNYKMNAS